MGQEPSPGYIEFYDQTVGRLQSFNQFRDLIWIPILFQAVGRIYFLLPIEHTVACFFNVISKAFLNSGNAYTYFL